MNNRPYGAGSLYTTTSEKKSGEMHFATLKRPKFIVGTQGIHAELRVDGAQLQAQFHQVYGILQYVLAEGQNSTNPEANTLNVDRLESAIKKLLVDVNMYKTSLKSNTGRQ